jgi:hypothetical protein
LPIPNPKSGEKEDNYISRCMSALANDNKPQDQKLAICYNTFRNAKKSILLKTITKMYDSIILRIIKAKGSKYINPDGTFKGGFEGCVKHFMEIKGLKKENAQKLCAYIKRRAGK